MRITLLELQSFIKHIPTKQQLEFLNVAKSPLKQLFQHFVQHKNEDIEEANLKTTLSEPNLIDLAKVYQILYQQLLTFLNKKRHSVVDEVHENLKSIQTLYELKQFSLCYQLLAETHTLAIENELFEAIHEILIWERTLTYYNTGYQKDIEQTFRTTISVCQKLSNLWQYRELHLKVQELDGNVVVRGDRAKRLKYFLQDRLLQQAESAKSINARLLHHTICATIHRNLEDYPKAHYHYQSLVELYNERAAADIERKWEAYLATINNYANISLFLKHYQDALLVSDMLKQLHRIYAFVAENNLETDLFIRAYFIEIQVYKERLEIEKALQLLPIIKQFIDKKDAPIKTMYKIGIVYEVAEVLFINNNFDKSIIFLKQIANLSKLQTDNDAYIMSLMLKLLIFVEQKDLKNLEKHTQKTKQYLKAHRINSRYEILFINLMEDVLYHYNSGFDTHKMFEEYIALFTAIQPFVEENIYFDITSWLQSKITDKTFLEIKKTKLSQSQN
ncbi:MAG: hypothetical protein ACPG5B_07805 [Chitinophagales bacterium]